MEEKTKGRVPAKNVASVSIRLLRIGGPAAVCEQLCSLQKVRMDCPDAQVRNAELFSSIYPYNKVIRTLALCFPQGVLKLWVYLGFWRGQE